MGGSDPAARLRAARLLVAAGLPLPASSFLAKPGAALAAKDAAALNLLALAAEGRFAKNGKPEDLELLEAHSGRTECRGTGQRRDGKQPCGAPWKLRRKCARNSEPCG